MFVITLGSHLNLANGKTLHREVVRSVNEIVSSPRAQSPMPCIALWFIVFATYHGLFVLGISQAEEAMFVHIHALAVVLLWLFFRFVGNCVFNGKWKADEREKKILIKSNETI